MLQLVIDSIVPVFILIALGWLSVKLKLMSQGAKNSCASIVTHYVFPALLFMQTAKEDINKILDFKWMLAFLFTISIIWVICFIVGIYFFRQSMKNSVMQSMLCTFTNMIGMGIPFLMQIIGPSALISVAKASFVVSLTLIPLTIFLFEMSIDNNQSKLSILIAAFLKSVRKPMFLAVILGTLVSFLGIYQDLPLFMTKTLNELSESCIFLALFTVGLTLYGINIRLSKVFCFNLFIKSFVCGFIAWLVVSLFGISGHSAAELIYIVVMPTATIATIFAIQWKAMPEVATSVYLASTLLAVITLPMWMILLNF